MGLDQGNRCLLAFLVSSVLPRCLLLLQKAALRRTLRPEHPRDPTSTSWRRRTMDAYSSLPYAAIKPRDILDASWSADEHRADRPLHALLPRRLPSWIIIRQQWRSWRVYSVLPAFANWYIYLLYRLRFMVNELNDGRENKIVYENIMRDKWDWVCDVWENSVLNFSDSYVPDMII